MIYDAIALLIHDIATKGRIVDYAQCFHHSGSAVAFGSALYLGTHGNLVCTALMLAEASGPFMNLLHLLRELDISNRATYFHWCACAYVLFMVLDH